MPNYSKSGKKFNKNFNKKFNKSGKPRPIPWNIGVKYDLSDFVNPSIQDKYQSFDNPDPIVTYDDIPGKLEYKEYKHKPGYPSADIRWVCHNGQVKLFLTEIQHLTHCLDYKIQDAIVFYAGSAPSNKAWKIAEMFPNVKFVFIDPNEALIYIKYFHDYHYKYAGDEKIVYMSSCKDSRYKLDKETTGSENGKIKRTINHYKLGVVDIETYEGEITYDEESMIDFIATTNYRIYIFNDYMNYDLAKSFNKLIKRPEFKLQPVLFWSDIRTNFSNPNMTKDRNDEDFYPSDIDIIANTAMMFCWARYMTEGFNGDFFTMFKFRIAYLNDSVNWDAFTEHLDEANKLNVDFKSEIEKSKALLMFPGTIYIQAYPGIRSGETRLWSNIDQIKSDVVPYHNKDFEEKLFYYNMLYRFCQKFKNPYANKVYGFDHCGDCALAGHILGEYKDKMDNNFDVLSCIKYLGRLTGRPLRSEPHGHNF